MLPENREHIDVLRQIRQRPFDAIPTRAECRGACHRERTIGVDSTDRGKSYCKEWPKAGYICFRSCEYIPGAHGKSCLRDFYGCGFHRLGPGDSGVIPLISVSFVLLE